MRRKVSHDERLRIVRLIEEEKRDLRLVADIFGVSRSSVYDWLRRYREGGAAALYPRATTGRPAALSEQQIVRLYLLIREHDPREFGFGAALWTRALVSLLIHHEFDVRLSPPTVVKILSKLTLHVPKRTLPLLRREDGSRSQQDTWDQSLHMAVRTRMLRPASTRLLYDVTRICLPDWPGITAERTLAARKPAPDRSSCDHMMYAVDTRGHTLFAVVPHQPETPHFIDFCTRLIHDCPAPTYLLMPASAGPPWDIAAIRSFVRSTYGRIGIFAAKQHTSDKYVVEI